MKRRGKSGKIKMPGAETGVLGQKMGRRNRRVAKIGFSVRIDAPSVSVRFNARLAEKLVAFS